MGSFWARAEIAVHPNTTASKRADKFFIFILNTFLSKVRTVHLETLEERKAPGSGFVGRSILFHAPAQPRSLRAQSAHGELYRMTARIYTLKMTLEVEFFC
jgi:hypothetical protein